RVWMHMDQWEGQRWGRSPGNAYSKVQKLHIDPSKGGTFQFEVTEVIPPIEFPADTDMVKRFRIQSEILSEFWGHPIYIGMTVLLPRGYEQNPSKSYPTIYKQGHFSTRPPYRHGPESEWMEDDFPRMLAVTIQHPSPYFDDSYGVNSANNGPYGDAIHQELIPEFEKRFRAINEPWARVLTGGSTGGWIAAALQVFYPDFYGGCWSFAPDCLDFRNVEGINIYEDKNAYYKIHEWRKVPTPNTRNPATGEIVLTSKQRNHFELVHGTKGRSGQQLDIWSAVWGPVGEDGYFKPLFDKFTGEIDPSVAEYWRENYDIRHILQRDWATLGPKLVGKLHFFAGRRDNFYLNIGVEHLEDFLMTTTDPYFAGSFSYGGRGGHSWSPFRSQGELIRVMATHIKTNMPAPAKSR
ncbi:MAG: alpha/beta hydrolase-fold protein, partial [Planctomycetota bacterium]